MAAQSFGLDRAVGLIEEDCPARHALGACGEKGQPALISPTGPIKGLAQPGDGRCYVSPVPGLPEANASY
ncbi:hypothetical protein SDC9_98285 [bioreactor metagenome]|uniref:Uncharacterized protein n=1 Tax=bioreactor metagenome TaxID=1076179 RepID=A0A645AF04_9ZZZZ